ncbi:MULTISPECIES: CBS domain-containing protein [Azospirillum]|uniref:CBS domain-containing protein n=1 Tax=Azospirillum brasilense TaxID=192 RepID=A0A0N7I987_AZOBR|nr:MULTISPECIES: CBS domain-containing protein [Azospirillum]ALJ39403.1 inosine-5-monophosphate dehydrogenase [Azospirillum brasilense]MDX5955984.1 CBS domain-containing protein [Azospirillum brasilense]OYD80435.1 CBS domain-containing protein [Azospirillum brasilense]PWC88191.1 inosine-5-monophosphate dehydrogenase [Azospirillum sp. Sp 7]
MQIREIMTRDVEIASPDDTIQKAAQMMKDVDTGMLPVGENDQLVGMITDRDITIRATAEGKGVDCKVRDVMTGGVCYVFEDETTEDASRNMSNLQVRRLPVVNRDKRLVGIVSLGDLAVENRAADEAQGALSNVSKPTR